jgi:hypothetical protein
MGDTGLIWFRLGTMVGYFERDDEPLGPTKGEEFLE